MRFIGRRHRESREGEPSGTECQQDFSGHSGLSPPEDLLRALDVASKAIAFVRRRNLLDSEEAEEFESFARLKLLENEAGIVRKFRGESSLETYLVVVVHRLLLDYRNERWGKWRTSAEARRLGPVAVLLERMLYRDHLTREQAIDRVAHRAEAGETREQLDRRCEQIPARSRREIVDDSTLAGIPAPGGSAEDGLVQLERNAAARKVSAALQDLLDRLDPEDRLVLKLHYFDGLNLSAVARMLGEDVKRLHRRAGRLLGGLRRSLESRGIAWPELATVVGQGDARI